MGQFIDRKLAAVEQKVQPGAPSGIDMLLTLLIVAGGEAFHEQVMHLIAVSRTVRKVIFMIHISGCMDSTSSLCDNCKII